MTSTKSRVRLFLEPALFHLQVAQARQKAGLNVRQIKERLHIPITLAYATLEELRRLGKCRRFWAKSKPWEPSNGYHVYRALDTK